MLTLVGVDLAAKFSALCHLDSDGHIRVEHDSWGRTEAEFIDLVTAPWIQPDPPAALVVEDLPHGVKYMTNTKNVCRLQGRIVERMDFYGALHHLWFAPPAEWRRSYVGLERGTGPDAVVPVAAEYGYTAPDLSHRILRAGDKGTAKKVATDYCAAYLITRWAITHLLTENTLDTLPGASKYGVPKQRPRKV